MIKLISPTMQLSELESKLKSIFGNDEINELDSKATDLISQMYDVNKDLEDTQKKSSASAVF